MMAARLGGSQADRVRTTATLETGDTGSGQVGRKTVEIAGTVRYLGSTGRFRIVASSDGRFVREIEAPAGDLAWFDGQEGQFVDWNGMPGPLLMYSLHWHQMQVEFLTGLWREGAAPLEIVEHGEDGTTLTVRHRDGPIEVTVLVRRDSNELVRLTYAGLRGVEELTFEGSRSMDDISVPLRVTHRINEIVNAVYEVESVGRADADETFIRDIERPDDFRFDPSASSSLDVRRAKTGQVLVKPRLNGEMPGWFIFDTGGGVSILAPKVAASLDLEAVGAMPVTSMWGTNESPLRRLEHLELGPLSISDLLVTEMDLSFLEPHFGVPIAGLLGYDVISRAVVTIEVADDSVKLFDPQGFGDHLDWQPLLIHGQHPVVHARFDRGEGLFRLDLGAAGGPGGNVLFNAPSVTTLALLDGRSVHDALAGTGRVAVGAIDWFELAGHRFDKPVVVFHLDADGPGGDPYLVGNIGVSFMEPFRVVFDYAGTRVALIPT